MSRLDIIDRIQIWNEQIFNVNIFPSHENSFQFKPIEDFIAVGIGPLNYKKEFLHLSKKTSSIFERRSTICCCQNVS